MELEPILVGNHTFSDLLRLEPFGWKLQDPPLLIPYKWELLDPIDWQNFPETFRYVSFCLGIVYVLAIFSLQHWMRNRPAFELRTPLFLWNVAFSIMPMLIVARVLPGMVHVLRQPDGFYRSVCLKENGDMTMGFWGLVFIVSKFFELGDTMFIILRKRPLHFLHWYHHLCTMIVCGIVAPMFEPITRWYGVHNSIAHSLVYPYLALKVIGVKMPSIVAKAITTLQLLEMFAGFLVNMTSLYFLQTGRKCARYPVSINAFLFVYGTFLILFFKLFCDSVIRDKRKKKVD